MKTKDSLVILISKTPLAGAPVRIVNALNKYTDFSARLINFNPNCYGARTFPEDLSWEKDREECLDLISKADILHFNHFFDIESENNPFGLNFRKLNPKAKIIRHFHSELKFIFGNDAYEILKNDKYPKIVIPHYPERTFLDAFVVPNIIPINSEILCPIKTNNSIPKVFFSASCGRSMWETRWNTKAVPQVLEKFKYLQRKTEFDFQLIQNTPYEKCMQLKQQSDIVIGDTTSGSYHLTDLEALSMGKPCFSYLDSRVQFTLQNLLKCDDLPFINTRLEEIDLPFIEIAKNKILREEIGKFSRAWIEKYYNDKNLVKFFEEVYQKVLNNEPLTRQNDLNFPNAKTFLYNDLYDMQWEMRKKYYPKIKHKEKMKLLQNIFSVKNNDARTHKICTILGIKLKFRKKCKILFFVSGGIGDILIDLNYLYYLKDIINLKKANITLRINRDDTSLLKTFLGKKCSWVNNYQSKNKPEPKYDLKLAVVSSYPTFLINNEQVIKMSQEPLYNLAKANMQFQKENPNLFNDFPRCIYQVNKKLIKDNKKRIQLPDFNNQLKVKKDFILPIPIKKEKKILKKYNLQNCKYITINRGVNPQMQGVYSPKMWDLENYNILCKLLKKEFPDIKLVQTGVSKEKCGLMQSIDVNLLGMTTLDEMIVILKNSILHIDGEGGMVHLKNALKGKSIVLFGPTNPAIYGYDNNINIRNNNACEECCDWKDENWLIKCIKTGAKATCMAEIKPQAVFEVLCEYLRK